MAWICAIYFLINKNLFVLNGLSQLHTCICEGRAYLDEWPMRSHGGRHAKKPCAKLCVTTSPSLLSSKSLLSSVDEICKHSEEGLLSFPYYLQAFGFERLYFCLNYSVIFLLIVFTLMFHVLLLLFCIRFNLWAISPKVKQSLGGTSPRWFI